MGINKLSEIAEQPARADKSAMGAINRPLREGVVTPKYEEPLILCIA
jgi:hypothetical protein